MFGQGRAESGESTLGGLVRRQKCPKQHEGAKPGSSSRDVLVQLLFTGSQRSGQHVRQRKGACSEGLRVVVQCQMLGIFLQPSDCHIRSPSTKFSWGL
jgi:hypothetical protein